MTIQATGIVPTLTTGQRLDIAMQHAGLKPESMAVQMRCSATTIRNYLAGRTRVDYAHMAMWAQITGVSLDWLLGEVTGGQPAYVGGHVSDERIAA